jgi:hypothetical protein
LEEILGMCPDPDGPLKLLWGVQTETSGPLATAIADVAKRFAHRAVPAVIDHLLMGDNAPLDEPAGFRLRFIASFGDSTALAKIRALIGQGVSAETLASRFVSVGYLMGSANPPGKLIDFDQKFFATYAPARDGLYDTPLKPDLDLKDLSWTNRRAYTHGHARPPALQVSPESDDQRMTFGANSSDRCHTSDRELRRSLEFPAT